MPSKTDITERLIEAVHLAKDMANVLADQLDDGTFRYYLSERRRERYNKLIARYNRLRREAP